MPGVLPAESGSASNLIIATPDWSDNATIIDSGGSVEAGTLVTNLQTMQPTDVWGATGTDVYVVLDRGSAQPWNTVALLWTNATAATTWEIRAAATQAALTGVGLQYTSTTFGFWDYASQYTNWPRSHGLLFLGDDVQTNRFIRIDVHNTPDPFHAGRLYIANAWQPSHNMQFGYRLSWVDRSKREEAGAVTVVRQVDPRLRKLDFTLDFLPQEEIFTNGDEIARSRGGSRDVFVCLDPTNFTHRHRKMCCGLLEAGAGIPITHTAYPVWQQEYQITELA